MKKLLIGLAVLAMGLVAYPAQAQEAEEMPVTFYVAFGGTAALDDEAAIKSASASIRVGIKTNLNSEGSWRLISEFNSINKPLKKNETNGSFVKSIDLGAERLYWLNARDGFLSNSAVVIRGVVDFELNRDENDANLGFGFGWLKKLSVNDLGQSNFAFQAGVDMLVREAEGDDISLFVTLNFTPFQ